jgi:hypothetical protein
MSKIKSLIVTQTTQYNYNREEVDPDGTMDDEQLIEAAEKRANDDFLNGDITHHAWNFEAKAWEEE